MGNVNLKLIFAMQKLFELNKDTKKLTHLEFPS